MSEELSEELRKDLDHARELHDRAVSDYEKCVEFNRLMSRILSSLEDNGFQSKAGKVMSLLIECNPKQGARCDKSPLVADRVHKL